MSYKKWAPRRRSFGNLHKRGSQAGRTEKQRHLKELERAVLRENSVQRYLSQALRREPSAIEALLFKLVSAERVAALSCSTQIVRTISPLVPSWPQASREAIEVAEAWIRGWASDEERMRTARAARECATDATPASFWYSPADGCHLFESAEIIPAEAKKAAACAANSLWGPLTAARTAAHAAAAHASALACRHTPYSARWRSTWSGGFSDHLSQLFDQIAALPWPRVEPSPEQICSAPPALAVAWDWVVQEGRGRQQSTEELVCAYARADRLSLLWSDPLQRAIAERTVDEVRVQQLLAVGQGAEGDGASPRVSAEGSPGAAP